MNVAIGVLVSLEASSTEAGVVASGNTGARVNNLSGTQPIPIMPCALTSSGPGIST